MAEKHKSVTFRLKFLLIILLVSYIPQAVAERDELADSIWYWLIRMIIIGVTILCTIIASWEPRFTEYVAAILMTLCYTCFYAV